MLADVVSGEVDLADVLFLIAVILFAIVTVLHVMAREVAGALLAGGLTAIALAWLVL